MKTQTIKILLLCTWKAQSIFFINISKFILQTKVSATNRNSVTDSFSAYGGGALGLSDRFASGFLWLNKLGLTAQKNYQVRNCFQIFTWIILAVCNSNEQLLVL
jgi:hypothetical protein